MSEKIEKLLSGKGENYIFPFFWQHGETEEVLREYMDVIDKSNIKAVCVESRPHPDFCGEKWWQDMDVILDEAKKRNMKVWILDDSHFPTGYANGALEKEPDTLRRQSICCRIEEAEGGETFAVTAENLKHPNPFQKTMVENFVMQGETPVFDDDELLGVYAVRMDREKDGFTDTAYRIDLTPERTEASHGDAGLNWQVPEGKWKIYTLHLSRNFGYHRSYINMMNRQSCKVLLDAVYEPHYAHYKELFGTTIAGFFSDEPEIGNGHLYELDDVFGTMVDFPWSRELSEQLAAEIGEENFWKLALLWENDADKTLTASVRYQYMDLVTRLVQKDFSEQIGNWCRAHGVKYIGHMIEDDNHHSRLGSSLGHYFRGLRGQDMAGIDDIGGQVLPQQENVSYNMGTFQHRDGVFYHYVLGKLASSAASLEPQKHGDSMCEIFGNYGWEEGVQLEKYLADHFLVRGVNHYVPHAFSAKDFPDPDCPPHFYAHGNNPQYRAFGALMAYMNRVCELLSDSVHQTSTALLYDGEADWTGTAERCGKAAQILYDRQADYDIIPQDVFAEREFYQTEILPGEFKVNRQKYRRLILTPTKYVTEAFAQAVKELTDAGVKVYLLGDTPEILGKADGEGRELDAVEQISYEILAEFAENKFSDIVKLSPSNDRIRCCHYQYEDGSSMLFFVNEGTETYEGNIAILPEVQTIYGYDAWNNQVYPVEKNGFGEVTVTIEPRKSEIFILNDPAAASLSFQKTVEQRLCGQEGKCTELTEGWKRSVCRSIVYPAFEGEKEISLPDPLAEEQPLFSGFVRYEKSITLEDNRSVLLEITDAAEGVEVFLNGKSLGIQIVPHYLYDLSEAAVVGENKLVIEVATTLEREMSVVPDVYGREKEKPTCGSGITGNVKLYCLD